MGEPTESASPALRKRIDLDGSPYPSYDCRRHLGDARHLAKLLGFESDIEVSDGTSGGGDRAGGEVWCPIHPMDINMPDMTASRRRTSLGAGTVRGGGDDVGSGEADTCAARWRPGREFWSSPSAVTSERPRSARSIPARGQGRPRRGRGPVARASDPAMQARWWLSSARRAASAGPQSPSTSPWPPPPTGKKVTLVDASFQFGDVAVLLNLNPKDSPGPSSCRLEQGLDPESVEKFTLTHCRAFESCSPPPRRRWPSSSRPPAWKHVITSSASTANWSWSMRRRGSRRTLLGILDLAELY